MENISERLATIGRNKSMASVAGRRKLNYWGLGAELKAASMAIPSRRGGIAQMNNMQPLTAIRFEVKIDEIFQEPRNSKTVMDAIKYIKELQTKETYSNEKIIEIIMKKVRDNLEVQLTMNLDVSNKELTKFLETKWSDYYNLIMPFLCLALNMNGINQRKDFFLWFAEELFTNDGVLCVLHQLLSNSLTLRNMLWILKMNITVENLGYKAQKNFTDYLDLISSARPRTISWSTKKRENADVTYDYLLLSSPPDKEGY